MDVKEYKKISRNIRLLYAGVILIVVSFAVASEWGFVPLEGAMVSALDGTAMYLLEVGVLFLVGIGIWLALKGGDWALRHKVCAVPQDKRRESYFALYCARLGLLGALMMLGVFFHYALLANWGMYYALAAFVASLFCLPSSEGVEIEMNMEG